MATKVYIRDTVHLKQQLINDLANAAGHLGQIIIAARDLRVDEAVSVDSRELVLIADRFDGGNGQIISTVPDAPVTPAENAQNGLPGMPVTILCRYLHGANVVSRGGNGQPGSNGKDGEAGADYDPATGDNDPVVHATRGKDGQPGSSGGDGGQGGQITLLYVHVVDDEDTVPISNISLFLQSQEGIGGQGGQGGKGGLGGDKHENGSDERMPDGEPGPPGANGTPGASLSPFVQQRDEIVYWNEVRNLLGATNDAPNWAKHRLKMAEYFFRQYIPNSPGQEGSLALSEVKAVLELVLPGSVEATRAVTLRSFLENNLSPTGVQRDVEPRLSVPYYSDDYALARERADAVVDRGLLFGMTAMTEASIRELIVGQKREFENEDTKDALEASLNDAKADQLIAQQALDSAKQTVDALSASIQERSAALIDEGESDLLDVITGPVAAGALAVGLGFVMGGPPGALAALPAAANYVLNSEEFKKFAGELLEDLPLDDFEQAAMTLDTVSRLSGSSDDTLNKAILSFKKFRSDLETARGKSDPLLLDLVQQQAVAVHEHFLAELRGKQAGFAVEAAQKHLDAIETNLKNWKDILDRFDKSQLRQYTVTLIEQARGAFDTVLRYQYKMARAIELYTLASESVSGSLRFDYGFAHPDIEQDFLEQTDDVTMLNEYLFSIATLSSTLPGDGYNSRFQEYTELGEGPQWTAPNFDVDWIIESTSEQELLERFQKTGRIDFTVALQDVVSKDWFESKISGVKLLFEGGTYNESFNPIFQHWGRSDQRRRPTAGGADVSQVLLPNFEEVPVEPVFGNATLASGQVIGDQHDPPNFWGRGLAATYTVAIKDYGKPGGPNIDLAGLRKLTVRFKVDTFASGLSAVQISSVSLPVKALLAGITTYGTLKVSAAAPQGGTVIKVTSNNPTVSVSEVKLAEGEDEVQFPINVALGAAGQRVTLTAQTSATSRTINVLIPEQPAPTLELALGARDGFNANVYGIAANGKYVYAAHYYSKIENANETFGKGELVVIDSTTFKEVPNTRISVGFAPRSVAVNPLTNRLYVMNRGATNVEPDQQGFSLSIVEINPADASKLKEITQLKLGAGLVDVTVNRQTNRVYVTDNLRKSIRVVNGETSQEMQSIQLPSRPLGITVDENTNTLYVATSDRNVNPFINAVIVVKITGETGDQTQAQIETIPIHADPANPDPTRPTQPVDVAFNPETNHLYVANLGGVNISPPCVTVINLTTREATTVNTISGARAIAVNPRLNQVYIGTDSGVQIMDGVTNTIVSTIPNKAHWGIAINPTTNQIYAGSPTEGTIAQIVAPDLSTITQWT